ncbi:hypothetical protein FB45DRAFT_886822 [Roridomyces roridus]|uniref:THUMP domain-containing protein n=1 Tax=Roridomyces roridus TaxID=1738132 RepID=A0AAD7FY86_9AGAR|nr:hypothetical protein FB45DRAFT_886822 [Roridomyces roridus]
MSSKRPSTSQGGSDRRKKKYRPDGTAIHGKRNIDGPGIWVTCIKGKEKHAVGELYELFNTLGSELWPETKEGDDSDSEPEEELSIEAQIASELSAMKKPKHEQRFANCQTNTACLVFISCKPPIDPVQLVATHLRRVQETGITHTRHSLRFSPVSASCVTNIPEIQAVCRKLFEPIFGESSEKKFKYKIEMRIRNHTTITRMTLIEAIAQTIPPGHSVDLKDPELVIIVEVFKAVCGVSVVQDYNKLQRFNSVEIANKHNKSGSSDETPSRMD